MPKDKSKDKTTSWKDLFAPRTVVATAALFVSVCSLVLTISQMRANREAQYLAVLPYVSCGIKNGNLNDDGTASFTYIIQNKGLGPAFLNSVKIKSGDQTFESAEIDRAIQHYANLETPPIGAFSSVSARALLPANEEILWFSPREPVAAHHFLKKLWSGDSTFLIKICFGDVYGRLWTVDSFHDRVEPCAICPF